jgi:hypothetical protein
VIAYYRWNSNERTHAVEVDEEYCFPRGKFPSALCGKVPPNVPSVSGCKALPQFSVVKPLADGTVKGLCSKCRKALHGRGITPGK